MAAVDVDVCFSGYDVFMTSVPMPAVSGISVAYSAIPFGQVCTLSVYSRKAFDLMVAQMQQIREQPPSPPPVSGSAAAPTAMIGSVIPNAAEVAVTLTGPGAPYVRPESPSVGVAFLTVVNSSDVLPIDQAPAIRTLSVDGGVVKTFFVGYFDKRLKKDGLRVADARAFATYYELDGDRLAGDMTSVILLRLNDVALRVIQLDDPTAYMMTGRFGQLWRFVKFPLMYLMPLVLVCCSRNFAADAAEGRLDGYTKDLLAEAWRPGFYIGFSKGMVDKLTTALS